MTRALAIAALLAAACGPRTREPPQLPSLSFPDAAITATTTAPDAAPLAPAGPDRSQPPAPGPEPTWSPPRPETFTLASGVRVVLIENHRLPLVSVRVIESRAGAREDGSHPGLAALTAEVLDEGAGEWTSTTLPEQLERLGAELESSIAADDATVALDTLRDSLEPSLALLADVLVRPRFAPADVARARGDRLAELRRRVDEPRLVASLVFERVVFGAHPYAQPPQGFLATVQPLGAKDLTAFWRDHYGPHATTIVVAGDVDRAALEPLLVAGFGAWTGGPADAAPPAPPAAAPHPAGIVFVDRPGAPQSVLVAGRLGPGADDPAFAADEVVNAAVGGSFTSRLNASLREQHGWTYGVGSGFWRGRWGGAWSLSTSLKTSDTVAALIEARAILDATRGAPLADDELARTVALLTRSMPQEFETNAGIASALERVVSLGLPDDWHQGWRARVRAVTAADAQRAADAAWRDLTIVVVGDWRAIGKGLTAIGLPIVQVDALGNPRPPRRP